MIIVPELNGNPIEFTKNTSKYPNNLSVVGSSNLNMKSKIAAEAILAIIKFLTVMVL
ncbi:hypothetical protein FBALC1_15257 [Flavobacteriales bacterium ALC-1]|nr:hypothetical protein FBALC1_15257 [Flavobacteriales bacterium ALC-1]